MVNIGSIDLNLLKLFACLYRTASVTIAAEELNLSQSACSHALQRLRECLDDELFVRVDKKMLPTEYALRLAEAVLPALQQLNKGLASSHAFSDQAEHIFRIAATDYAAWNMQDFTAYLSREYPKIKIEFIQLDERLPDELLQTGQLDLICGVEHQKNLPESLVRLEWFEDDYLCLRCNDHQITEPMTLEYFLSCKHVLVTPWNEARGVVDLGLSKLRKKRQVAIKMASLLAAPYFVSGTDYLLVVPRKYAEQIKGRLALQSTPLPFAMEYYKLSLYWHKTYQNDAKLKWFTDKFSDFYQLPKPK
jgi:DNA-binding transcriptional LysR family regulator